MMTPYSLRSAALVVCSVLVNANSKPEFEFNLKLQTPQLIGIIVGCVVFCVTISSVIYLLFSTGSWSRFVAEMQSGKPLVLHKDRKSTTTLKDFPKLYDELVEASVNNPLILDNMKLESNRLTIRNINLDSSSEAKRDINELYEASNGSALYNESSYDPCRIWMWNENNSIIVDEEAEKSAQALLMADADNTMPPSADTLVYPAESRESFQEYLQLMLTSDRSGRALAHPFHYNVSLLCVVDKEFGHAVGMCSLVNNNPRNLSIQIGKKVGIICKECGGVFPTICTAL